MIKNLDDTFIKILNKIWQLILPILLIVLFITLIKIIIDYQKYGKSVFSSFKKREKIDVFSKTLELYIKKLSNNYRLIKIDKNMFILILECGIYTIYWLDYVGVVSGNIEDKYLLFKPNTSEEEQIENPIYKLKVENKKLQNKLKEEINGYVLLKERCLFSVLNRTNIKTIPFNAFYYHFSKFDKKYSKETIDEIYEKIVN